MKTYLLVFDDMGLADIDLPAYIDTLDAGAEMYAHSERFCFIKSDLSAAQLTDRFLKFAGSSLFFVTDISKAEYSGQMIGRFWDFLKQPRLETAAE